VYTTNAIEALNRQLRKAIKTKGHFPNEEAARKLIYLAITNAVPAWTRTRNWTTALLAFKIHSATDYPSDRLHRISDALVNSNSNSRASCGRVPEAGACMPKRTLERLGLAAGES